MTKHYGSSAHWSGRLAAMLFSLLQTLSVWCLDLRAWLTAYLTACAEASGKPPADAVAHLPWNLTDQRRKEWTLESRPGPPNNDSS